MSPDVVSNIEFGIRLTSRRSGHGLEWLRRLMCRGWAGGMGGRLTVYIGCIYGLSIRLATGEWGVGVMWCSVVQCSAVMWFDVIWCNVIWCDMMWCDDIWCDMLCDMICDVMICDVMIRDHISCSVVWCGVVWCGVVWCGVVWCGVVRWFSSWVSTSRHSNVVATCTIAIIITIIKSIHVILVIILD